MNALDAVQQIIHEAMRARERRRLNVHVEYAPHVESVSVYVRPINHDYVARSEPPLWAETVYLDDPKAVPALQGVLRRIRSTGVA